MKRIASIAASLLAGALLFAAPASGQSAQEASGLAQPQDDVWSHVINMSTAGSWDFNPAPHPRPALVATQGQSFQQALRVTAHHSANPWDMQATSSTGGNIARGDTVLVMVFVRAQQAADGGSHLPVRLQLKAAPYTALVESTFDLSDQWKQLCMAGVAAQDFPKDGSTVALHLATGDQVVDLGPVFVFDFGQNYDQGRLPHCAS